MKVALCGPILAGKSSVAKLLEGLHGYTYINFTDYLKEMAADALKAYDHSITAKVISKDKEKYRGFLQEFGILIGFHNNPGFISRLLSDRMGDNMVFDSVRTDDQWKVLKDLGFKLVRIYISSSEQVRRADHMGLDSYEIRARQSHAIENSLSKLPYRTYDSSRSSAESVAAWIAGDTPQPEATQVRHGNPVEETIEDRNNRRNDVRTHEAVRNLAVRFSVSPPPYVTLEGGIVSGWIQDRAIPTDYTVLGQAMRPPVLYPDSRGETIWTAPSYPSLSWSSEEVREDDF